MPYFKWNGVDLSGRDCTGVCFARTPEVLEKILLEKEIALLSARQARHARLIDAFSRVAGYAERADLCNQMSILLNAGLRLDEALVHVSKMVKKTYFKEMIFDCARAVREGSALSEVLGYHEQLFDSAAASLVAAGEESGALAQTFVLLAERYAAQEELSRKLKASLTMPFITLVFFLIMAFGIFVVVMPRFEALFVMLNKPLPTATRVLFKISRFVRSRLFWWTLGGVFVVAILGMRLFSSLLFKRRRDRAMLSIPFVGNVLWSYSMGIFLHTLALLVQGGVHLTKALAMAQGSIGNSALVSALEQVRQSVEAGSPLSESIKRFPLLARGACELESLCALGETTGELGPLLLKAAQIYKQKTHQSLSLIMRLLPPLVLLCLGALVAILIFAVYTPLLNFSQLMG